MYFCIKLHYKILMIYEFVKYSKFKIAFHY